MVNHLKDLGGFPHIASELEQEKQLKKRPHFKKNKKLVAIVLFFQ